MTTTTCRAELVHVKDEHKLSTKPRKEESGSFIWVLFKTGDDRFHFFLSSNKTYIESVTSLCDWCFHEAHAGAARSLKCDNFTLFWAWTFRQVSLQCFSRLIYFLIELWTLRMGAFALDNINAKFLCSLPSWRFSSNAHCLVPLSSVHCSLSTVLQKKEVLSQVCNYLSCCSFLAARKGMVRLCTSCNPCRCNVLYS